MPSSRRVRRECAQIEFELSRDEQFTELFASAGWPDPRSGQLSSPHWSDLFLRPATFWRAWLTTIVLQFGIAVSCDIASTSQQPILVVMVLVMHAVADKWLRSRLLLRRSASALLAR